MIKNHPFPFPSQNSSSGFLRSGPASKDHDGHNTTALIFPAEVGGVGEEILRGDSSASGKAGGRDEIFNPQINGWKKSKKDSPNGGEKL